MLTDGNFEYELTRRDVMYNGAKSRRFITVRRKVGKEKWYRVPDTPSFATLDEAERRFAVFRLNHGLMEAGQ